MMILTLTSFLLIIMHCWLINFCTESTSTTAILLPVGPAGILTLSTLLTRNIYWTTFVQLIIFCHCSPVVFNIQIFFPHLNSYEWLTFVLMNGASRDCWILCRSVKWHIPFHFVWTWTKPNFSNAVDNHLHSPIYLILAFHIPVGVSHEESLALLNSLPN